MRDSALGKGVCAVLLLCGMPATGEGVSGMTTPFPTPWHYGLHGFWEEKAQSFFTNRILGAEARTTVYEEAVNAFRTHYDDNGSWQGEYWGKTMLSAVAVERLTRDYDLATWIVTNATAFVREFQRADGYISSYSDPAAVGPNADGSERFCWNVWSRKYTMWALIEIANMIRDDGGVQLHLSRHGSSLRADVPLEAAAIRIMDHLMTHLDSNEIRIERTGYFAGLASMSILKPCMLLYRRTGKNEYLRFAERIVGLWERDGNPKPNLVANAFSGKPVHEWYPKPEEWAKAYEMMSCLEGVLDYAELTQNARLVDAVRRIVDKLHEHEANPFGSVGYFDHFTNARTCPNATTELCDVIHWMRLARAVFLATREPKYIDYYEDAYLNGFLPGIFRDGRWAAHATRSHGCRQLTAPHQVNMKFHHCCVDNACRTWYNVFETAAALDGRDGTFYVNLYFNGKFAFLDGRGPVHLDVRTRDYPFCDKVVMTVDSRIDRMIKFRAPASLDDFRVNGVAATNGWVSIRYDTKKPNGTWFTATWSSKASLHDWNVPTGSDPRAKLFEQVAVTPESKGMSRTEGAAYLKYGPVLLAKSSLVGDTASQVFDFKSVLGRGYSVSLEPIKSERVRRCWKATFTNATDSFSVNVCDLQSCDLDDPKGAFSIWF